MPKATTVFKYSHQELAALMVKDQGIKKGYWMIQANFGWSVSNVVDPTGDVSGPGTLSILTSIGIQEAAEPTPFTIDASTLWEKTANRKQRATAKKRRRAPARKARA